MSKYQFQHVYIEFSPHVGFTEVEMKRVCSHWRVTRICGCGIAAFDANSLRRSRQGAKFNESYLRWCIEGMLRGNSRGEGRLRMRVRPI